VQQVWSDFSSSSADLASVRLPLLFCPTVLLLIFSLFSGAAQGHAISFSSHWIKSAVPESVVFLLCSP
jgi:hypothetical protein